MDQLNLNKINMQNQFINSFNTGKMGLIEKIEKYLEGKADNNDLNLLLDSIRFRHGATGRERLQTI